MSDQWEDIYREQSVDTYFDNSSKRPKSAKTPAQVLEHLEEEETKNRRAAVKALAYAFDVGRYMGKGVGSQARKTKAVLIPEKIE